MKLHQKKQGMPALNGKIKKYRKNHRFIKIGWRIINFIEFEYPFTGLLSNHNRLKL